jgi:predicted RNA-binding protein YlxR (DUF448 family)
MMLADVQDRVNVEDLDTGPRSGAAGTTRSCALTGEVAPVSDLLRFVVAPDGSVVPDLKRRLPGRGLWITATRQALADSVKRRVFARGFKRDVRAMPDLVDVTERLLEQAVLDALAILRKAGRVAVGFTQTESALEREPMVALINAADAAADGSRKLLAALRRREDAVDIAVVDLFTSAQLDLALGRSNVIHAALLAGPESETFLARLGRFERFRSGCPGKQSGREKRR